MTDELELVHKADLEDRRGMHSPSTMAAIDTALRDVLATALTRPAHRHTAQRYRASADDSGSRSRHEPLPVQLVTPTEQGTCSAGPTQISALARCPVAGSNLELQAVSISTADIRAKVRSRTGRTASIRGTRPLRDGAPLRLGRQNRELVLACPMT
jgi:hypothetical protein